MEKSETKIIDEKFIDNLFLILKEIDETIENIEYMFKNLNKTFNNLKNELIDLLNNSLTNSKNMELFISLAISNIKIRLIKNYFSENRYESEFIKNFTGESLGIILNEIKILYKDPKEVPLELENKVKNMIEKYKDRIFNSLLEDENNMGLKLISKYILLMGAKTILINNISFLIISNKNIETIFNNILKKYENTMFKHNFDTGLTMAKIALDCWKESKLDEYEERFIKDENLFNTSKEVCFDKHIKLKDIWLSIEEYANIIDALVVIYGLIDNKESVIYIIETLKKYLEYIKENKEYYKKIINEMLEITDNALKIIQHNRNNNPKTDYIW